MSTTDKNTHSGLTIYRRLFLGFIIFSLPLLAVTAVFLAKIEAMVHISESINLANSLPSTLDTGIYEARNTLYYWALTGEPTLKSKLVRDWEGIAQTTKQWDDVINAMHDPHMSDLWNKLKPLYDTYQAAQFSVLDTPRNAQTLSTIVQNIIKIKPIGDQMLDIVDGPQYPATGVRTGGIYDQLFYKVDDDIRTLNHQLIILRYFAYGLLMLAIALFLTIPFITARSIRRTLDKSIEIAEKISVGERNIDIEATSSDEMGKLLAALKKMQHAIKENEEKIRAREEEARQLSEQMVKSSKKFSAHSSKVAAGDLRERLVISAEDVMQDLGKDLNLMTDGLADITKKITEASNNIVTMSEQIMPAANEESENITAQALAINQINTSLEEIDKSSKQTILRAQALREAAKNTYQQGKLGTESISQSINGIKDSEGKVQTIAKTILNLSNHMQQIGEITAMVNTLAQQSKMLALNAAIEASKAGEAGKGFAAVAHEVKNLAEQSEQATVQVQKILEDIRHATEKAVIVTEEGTKALGAGTQLIERAGEVIQTLTKMIDEASIASQQIETAITQEGVGIEQIVAAMNEINRATSAFASGIKETTSFIQKLAKIAKHLKEAVNIYKT